MMKSMDKLVKELHCVHPTAKVSYLIISPPLRQGTSVVPHYWLRLPGLEHVVLVEIKTPFSLVFSKSSENLTQLTSPSPLTRITLASSQYVRKRYGSESRAPGTRLPSLGICCARTTGRPIRDQLPGFGC